MAEDHRRAASLPAALAGAAGVETPVIPRPTNMALFRVPGVPAEDALERLAAAGVLGLPITTGLIRLVVHREHSDTDVERAAERIISSVPAGDT